MQAIVLSFSGYLACHLLITALRQPIEQKTLSTISPVLQLSVTYSGHNKGHIEILQGANVTGVKVKAMAPRCIRAIRRIELLHMRASAWLVCSSALDHSSLIEHLGTGVNLLCYRALATSLRCIRASGGARPIELLRKESLAGLAPAAAARVLSHAYVAVVPIAPLPYPPLPLAPNRPGALSRAGPQPL